jgi:hypothetical protein
VSFEPPAEDERAEVDVPDAIVHVLKADLGADADV